MTDQELIDKGYIEGKKSFECMADEIFKDFNWKKVHKAMKALNWEWYLGCDSAKDYKNNEDKMGIPSINTIKNAALRYLKQAYDEENCVGSGGLWASWDNGVLCLSFVLEEASF